MHVRYLIALASLGALSITALAGCTDAGKCERGTLGCAPFMNSGRCGPGLVASGGSCIADDGPDRRDGGMREPGPPPEVTCEDGSLEQACVSFCEALCQNQLRFCAASECDADTCEPGSQIVSTCTSQCNSVSCATSLCERQIEDDLTCTDFGVENRRNGVFESLCFESDPLCVHRPDLGCTDTCGTQPNNVGGELVGNGRCEDGHDEDAVASRCPRGTDCTDCDPHPCVPQGMTCVNHGDCCGFYGPGALCVDPDGRTGPELPFCLVTCDEDNPCSEGYRCSPTSGASDVCVPSTAM